MFWNDGDIIVVVVVWRLVSSLKELCTGCISSNECCRATENEVEGKDEEVKLRQLDVAQETSLNADAIDVLSIIDRELPICLFPGPSTT
jgi:hypothetical protein